MNTLLCADIGGTNTRLLLFRATTTGTPNVEKDLLFKKSYLNEQYPSFLDVLHEFLKEAKCVTPPVTACFAVAGPVIDNVVRFTNRMSWVVDGNQVAADLGIKKVKLINDFVANGYGLLTLDEKTECVQIIGGPKVKSAPVVCLGAGTGLGECFLTPNETGQYTCFPSEGGHSEFAPRNDLEMELLRFLKSKFEQKHRISVERVVSGTGLANVYEFLSSHMPNKVNPVVHEKIQVAGDQKGRIIAESQQDCELCKQVMEIFVTAYGAEAGVLGLKFLPYGGLYLTGGLTPKNLHLIKPKDGPFLHAFFDKGRVSGMLTPVPVFAVLAEDLGVRGAQLCAHQDYMEITSAGKGESFKATSSAAEGQGALLRIVAVATVCSLALTTLLRYWKRV